MRESIPFLKQLIIAISALGMFLVMAAAASPGDQEQNLECCISLRGMVAEKGKHCPFYYRFRPEMLRCLAEAGIDIFNAANNHGGDHGPVRGRARVNIVGIINPSLNIRRSSDQ